MIEITCKNNKEVWKEKWNENEYTDYTYDGKIFAVIKEKCWVGIYNIENVIEIICK